MDSAAGATGDGGGRRRYESRLRQEQQLATRERILDALADVLTEHGGATVPAVAERAGVSERTVYRHFPTRDDLFSGLFAWVMQLSPGERPTAPSLDGLVEVVREMFPRFDRRPEVIRALNSNDVGREMRKNRAGYRRKNVRDALAPSLDGVDAETRRRVEAVVHLVSSSTGYLHLHDFWDMSADDAADTVEWAVRALVSAAVERGDDGGRPRARVARTRTRKLGG